MSDKDENGGDNFNNSIDGEFPSDADENGLSSSNDSENFNKKRRTQTPSPSTTGLDVPASPPKFVSFEQLMSAANGVKNMTLAHEIAVDNDFKLEKLEPQANSLDKQVRDIMHKAFWDVLLEKMNADPQDYTPVLDLLQEVKENLLSLLLPQHVRLKAQIHEIVDMELIKQKMEQGAFDIYYYSEYVISTLSKLCAPVRDENIARLRQLNDVVPLFRELFALLELMKMDMANYTIQQIRPYLQQQSVDYERTKFTELLKTQEENGRDGLQLTKLWLQRGVQRLEEQQERGSAAASTTTPATILNEAYMELLLWDDKEPFPETLLLDQSRFLDVQEKTNKLTLISAVLLVTYNTVGTPIAGVQTLKEKLKSDMCVILDGVPQAEWGSNIMNVAEQVNKEVCSTLKQLGFSEREHSQQSLLIGQIKDVLTKNNPIYKLIYSRVLNFIHQTSFTKHSEPFKVPAGLSAVEKELSQVCGQFLRLIAHNRAVFAGWYINLVGALMKRQQPDLSPVKPSTATT